MILAAHFDEILKKEGLPIAGVSYSRTLGCRVNGWITPPTTEQETRATTLLAEARIAEFAVNGQVVTITAAADEIALLIGDDPTPESVPLENGHGEIELTDWENIESRVVRAAHPQVFGYQEITVYAT